MFVYLFGDRTDETFKRLLALLEPIKFSVYCTDDGGAYRRLLLWEKHLISKRYTQNIEHQNLNFRFYIKRLARRTICYSKSIELHDKVIDEYIRRHSFLLVWYTTMISMCQYKIDLSIRLRFSGTQSRVKTALSHG